MKLGVILSSNDPETAFNALRLANFAVSQGDQVAVFLLGKGVEMAQMPSHPFDVPGQARALLEAGGQIAACGTCLRLRNLEGSQACAASTMKDLYELVRTSERLVCF